MKGFKFKLEGLLKVRKFNEERIKTELGHLQVMLENKKKEIANEEKILGDSFGAQDALLRGGVNGNEIRFFPMYIEGKRQKIEQLKEELAGISEAVEEKREEWVKARGDVKVIDRLKEKELLAYKKEMNKKENKKLEENVLLWLENKKLEAL